MAEDHVRIGLLGAATITPFSLIGPAKRSPGVRVTAVAARDPERAQAFARHHKIPVVHPSYEALLADPDIDAVYVALPASLHARWTIAAIRAGKHVLCEKPFTGNAAVAEGVAAAAKNSDRVVMEAYHTHYHPLMARIRQIIDSGELGRLTSASATFAVPNPPGQGIRYELSLGGGCLLDVGYYPVRLLRDLLGEATVISADAAEEDGVDRAMSANLEVGGVPARMASSMWSRRLIDARLRITGEDAELKVLSPYTPQYAGRLTVTDRHGKRVEKPVRRSTYAFQLEAFRDAVLHGAPVATGVVEAVAQMRVLDQIYLAAGMSPRP